MPSDTGSDVDSIEAKRSTDLGIHAKEQRDCRYSYCEGQIRRRTVYFWNSHEAIIYLSVTT